MSGFEPRIIAEVGRMLTNLNMAGIGVSCGPESMRQVAHQGVVYAIPEAPTAARSLLRAPLTLVYRVAETRPAVLGFIAEARRLIPLARTRSPVCEYRNSAMISGNR